MDRPFKKQGCCTVCDVPIFEIVSRFTDGPRKGEIQQVGMPLPGARRFYVVRVSGRTSFWSLCASCTIEPSNMVALNQKEIAAMVRDRDFALDNPAQAESRDKMLRLFRFDIPIGVLGQIPWAEVR